MTEIPFIEGLPASYTQPVSKPKTDKKVFRNMVVQEINEGFSTKPASTDKSIDQVLRESLNIKQIDIN